MSPKKIEAQAPEVPDLDTAAARIVARGFRPPLTEHVNLAVDPELADLIESLADYLAAPGASQQRSAGMRMLFEMGAAAFLAERVSPKEYRAMRNAVLRKAQGMLDAEPIDA